MYIFDLKQKTKREKNKKRKKKPKKLKKKRAYLWKFLRDTMILYASFLSVHLTYLIE